MVYFCTALELRMVYTILKRKRSFKKKSKDYATEITQGHKAQVILLPGLLQKELADPW